MAVGWRRRGRDPAEWGLATSCLLAFAIGAIAWALLLFGGTRASTVIHQGSLLLPILGLCAAAVGVRAVFPRFGAWLLGANALVMLAIYVPSLEPLEGTAYAPWAGLLAAVSLAAFTLVAIRREPAPRTAPVAAAAE